ncbi:hypothetical protein [Streptomyces sp. ODS05-4]|uniref:hypothetical protein n=1 Tax=Streptomyces sp. ODS05-4 TaxID=2944939 RepID=UPI0021088456|nr:hypothetical protein [Streptomyces sp. ODS05-4]
MDTRALSRADAAALAAAALLVASSFLTFYSAEGCRPQAGMACSATAWKDTMLPVLLTLHAAGLATGALVLASVLRPGRRVSFLGLDLFQWTTACALFTAWSAVGPLFGGGAEAAVDTGAVLGTAAALLLAAAVAARGRVPALDLPLLPASAPRPAPARPAPAAGNPYAGHSPSGTEQRPRSPFGGPAWPAEPTHAFAPFWFSVPEPRPLLAEHPSDGASQGELYPHVWYLAVGQAGPALVVETPDQRRGRLESVSGLHRWGG